MVKLLDIRLVNGKPHGGMIFGSCITYLDPLLRQECKDRLEMNLKNFDCFEVRDIQWTENPGNASHFYDLLCTHATISVKFMVFGRAYKIHKLFKKGTRKRRKRCWINNRRQIR